MNFRFKTEKEFKDAGLWDSVNGVPASWNRLQKMNHLIGTEIPSKYHPMCLSGEKFSIEDPNDSSKSWNVSPIHYMSFEKTSVAQVQQERREAYTPGPSFDIERLSSEIDEMFDKKLGEAVQSHSEISVHSLQAAKQLMTDYLTKVKSTFQDIKSELLAEVSRGRTTIILNDITQIDVQFMDHPKMEDVVKSMNLHHKVMLVGPAGTGKTFMVAEIAERMNLPFYKYSCSRDSSVHDLLGYKQPRSEEYLETVFLKAYEQGGVFLVDEYDAMSGDMSLFFNGVADNSKFISIPHRDSAPVAKKHKDFYLVMCGNTWGKGSIEFSGRDFQDMALMDRFRLCRHHIGYHNALEKEWMGVNYNYAIALRESLEKIGNYLSTRNIEDISNLINSGVDKKEITAMICEDIDEQGSKQIMNELKSRNFI